MPGVTLMLTSPAAASHIPRAAGARDLLLHGPEYRTHSALTGHGIDLGWAAYDQYPVSISSTDGYLVYFEGRIYNRPLATVQADLASIAGSALGPAREDAGVERFILANEGAYVVVIVRREPQAVLVFNDVFGRLPLYYSVDATRLILAREAKFVHFLRPNADFDRIGFAQFIAFGLPLGNRTLLEGVRSFPDAGLLRAEIIDGSVRSSLRRLHTWNLDDEDRSRPLRQQAGEFADAFVSACRNWGGHGASAGNIVSLSGGHDSRAVAAGLVRATTPVAAVTYRDPNGAREDEVRCARSLAGALRIDWHCLDLTAPTQSAYEQLAWLKDGMNWASMAFILRYLEEIVRRWSPSHTYLSGDGGDDCLKVTAPHVTFRRTSDVTDYLLDKETHTRPELAEAIVNAPRGALAEDLHGILEAYPERDLARKVKHFKIFERGRRCYFEGEDRTRFFLWQDSPFYSLPVFRHSMRVPDRWKEHKTFCRQALLALSPAAAHAPEISSGYSPASWQYAAYHWLKDTALNLPSPLVKVLRHLKPGQPHGPYVAPADLTAYFESTPTTLFQHEHIREVLRELKSEHAFFCLWTVAMLEKVYRERGTQVLTAG